ncbi:unnamed protein product [Anisakis simplex]|uniref:Beta-catenin/armadillo-related protein 1 (inferred by orthology to a C. elegans protein) n=1 Tax=Anisakis simplex TaxID=6269 RepID=A0A0M3K5S3_ANISI|nr:unnamed protein product [Anisakis simplex]
MQLQQSQSAQIAMTNAASDSSNTKIAAKSAIRTTPNASQFIPQPLLTSSQVPSSNDNNAQVPPSYNANKGPSSTNASMFRVQMWSNNFDSGVQSLNHSSAASLLSMSCSSIRCGSSQISTMSSEEMDQQQQLTDQQQQKFDKIPASIGRLKSSSTSASSTSTAVSSVTANQESNDENQIRNAIPELINLLCDQDEVVVQRAAIMVQNIAKMDSEQPLYSEQSPLLDPYKVIPSLKLLLGKRSNSSAIIKPTLGALFQISERSDGLEAILRFNEQSNGALLTDIIQHIKFTGGTAIRYAILTFHTIIADRQSQTIHVRNIERARSNGALQSITYFLDHECNEKLLSVLVECVRLLCDKSTSQRVRFLFISVLLVMDNNNNLRYRCALSGNSNVHVKNVSAVDPMIVLYCTGILSNLLANNQRNKEFVFMNGAISILYRVLINSYSIPAITPNQQQRVEDIQERALATLRHLCVGHAHQQEAQKGVIQTEMGCEFLLRKLTEMRPSILKQTLQILNKAVLQDCNLQTIKETRLRLSPEYETNFTERIIVVLKVACEQLPSVSFLVYYYYIILADDNDSKIEMVYLMRRSEYMLYGGDDEQRNAVLITLPIYCLYQRYVDDENIIRSALGLISELACNQEMASVYACDSTLLSAFEHYSTSRNQAFGSFDYIPRFEAMSLTPSVSTNSTELTQQPLIIDEREGMPSSYSNNNIVTDMECSSEVWPEVRLNECFKDDLSGLSLNDDPFASMFCSHPFDSSQQQSHRIVYPPGTSRISSSVSSSETGTPAVIATTVPSQPTATNTSFIYNPNSNVNNNHFYHNSSSNISSVQMGSPEAHAAPWHDPSSIPFHNYQL